MLRILRVRIGAFGRYALSRASYLRLDVGVEGARVDTGASIEHIGGAFAQVGFGIGSAVPGANGTGRTPGDAW